MIWSFLQGPGVIPVFQLVEKNELHTKNLRFILSPLHKTETEKPKVFHRSFPTPVLSEQVPGCYLSRESSTPSTRRHAGTDRQTQQPAPYPILFHLLSFIPFLMTPHQLKVFFDRFRVFFLDHLLCPFDLFVSDVSLIFIHFP